MFVSAFIFYHWFVSFLIPSDGKKRVSYFMLPEMQKIFSNCSTENDKIRSSVFIEVIAVNYGLDEDLRDKLVNKLDPDNNDFMYTKDELFVIFKDWISSEPSAEKSPPFVPLTFTSPGFGHASTPALPSELMRRRLPRTRLFIQGKQMNAFGNHSGSPRVVQIRSDHSDSHYGSDDVDLDVSHSSSSTKRRLSHHRSILESKLENSERHASSLEKRYEDANSICALQKIEIERLKMELRNYLEVEQTMEEISEERRKIELETEKKFAKLQAELCNACTRIEDFELMNANLRQELSQAVENCQHWENEALHERERFFKLHNDFTEKEVHYEELLIRSRLMEQQNTDNDQALSKLMEENSALTSEINDLKSILSGYDHPHTYGGGIPLCEELPSEMLQFPINEGFSPDESTFTLSSNSSGLKTSSCQTDNILGFTSVITNLVLTDRMESVINQEEMPSSSIPTEVTAMKTYSSLTNVSTQYSLESLCTDDFKKTVICQTEDILPLSTVENFSQVENETLENFSQTGYNETQSNLTQTELLYNLFSVCCQTDSHELHSTCSQTEHFEMQPNFSQTEIFELQSTCSQTELVTLQYNYTQTGEVVLENSSQTENYQVHMNSTQTECVEIESVCSQTVDKLANFTQTQVAATIDSPSQTEIVILNTSCSQTSVHRDISLQTHVRESVSSFSQTVWSSIFCQTESCNDHLPCMMQTPVEELICRSSQVGACKPSKSNLQDQRLRVVVKMICCLASLFPHPNSIGRFVYSSIRQVVMIVLSIVIALISIFFVFFFVCQDNRCQLQLRYPKGPPPV